MTTQKTQVTEPARPKTADVEQVTEPDRTPSVRMVYVYDTNTPKPHTKLADPVPENWLRQFPNLKQVPSGKDDADTKEGK